MTQITCPTCGKVVDKPAAEIKRGAKYCSPECYHIAQRKPDSEKKVYVKKYPNGRRVDCVCQVCGKSFWVHAKDHKRGGGKYCSRECHAKALLKYTDTKPCEHCGKPIRIKGYVREPQRFCSHLCKFAHMFGANNPKWKNDRDYRGPNWKAIRAAILKRDNHTCQVCGATGRLDVHHKTQWIDTQDNSPDNLITVCKSCHSKIHYGDKLARHR